MSLAYVIPFLKGVGRMCALASGWVLHVKDCDILVILSTEKERK